MVDNTKTTMTLSLEREKKAMLLNARLLAIIYTTNTNYSSDSPCMWPLLGFISNLPNLMSGDKEILLLLLLLLLNYKTRP